MKMSFYNGTLDRQKLIELINKAEDIRYTYGYAWKRPTTLRKPITKAMALQIVNSQSLLDADDESGYLHLNAFSESDMW